MAIDQGLDVYFGVNARTYGRALDTLMLRFFGEAPPPSPTIGESRRAFVAGAIAKGADFENLPDGMVESLSGCGAEELEEALARVPDKQAIGWRGGAVGFDPDVRESFAAAGRKRSEAMRWDSIFPEGRNDIILPFSQSATSLSQEVRDYLRARNKDAAKAYRAACAEDNRMAAGDSSYRRRAGKDSEQQVFRLDPANPAKLQSFNWKNKKWQPAVKLNKLLQNDYAWGLYDRVQIGLDRGELSSAQVNGHVTAEEASFLSIANRSDVAGDFLHAAGKLCILVSRDPQKVGEMSTGQRWRSCMAVDGVNFHFVPRDIEEGTLVSYVVHEDDPTGRYPLMRCALKPFRNEAGESILVPAKIYGGSGLDNSATRNDFMETLQQFAGRQCKGMSGTFNMPPLLYADGQATSIAVSSEMTLPEIRESLRNYVRGAYKEIRTEIEIAHNQLREGMMDAFGADPNRNIATQTRKLRQLFSPDENAGLPRMFYRAMAKNFGVPPSPRLVVRALQTDKTLRRMCRDFETVMTGKPGEIDKVTARLANGASGEWKEMMAFSAAALTPATDSGKDAVRAEKVGTLFVSVPRVGTSDSGLADNPSNPESSSHYYLQDIKVADRDSVACVRTLDWFQSVSPRLRDYRARLDVCFSRSRPYSSHAEHFGEELVASMESDQFMGIDSRFDLIESVVSGVSAGGRAYQCAERAFDRFYCLPTSSMGQLALDKITHDYFLRADEPDSSDTRYAHLYTQGFLRAAQREAERSEDKVDWLGALALHGLGKCRRFRREVIELSLATPNFYHRHKTTEGLLTGTARPDNQTDTERLQDYTLVMDALHDPYAQKNATAIFLKHASVEGVAPAVASGVLDRLLTFVPEIENSEEVSRRSFAICELMEAYALIDGVLPLTEQQQEGLGKVLDSLPFDRKIRTIERMACLENIPDHQSKNDVVGGYFRTQAMEIAQEIGNTSERAQFLEDVLEHSRAPAEENEQMGRLLLETVQQTEDKGWKPYLEQRLVKALENVQLPEESSLREEVQTAFRKPLVQRVFSACLDFADKKLNKLVDAWNARAGRNIDPMTALYPDVEWGSGAPAPSAGAVVSAKQGTLPARTSFRTIRAHQRRDGSAPHPD